MTINEEHRQAEVAAEVEQAARTLAHSTRAVPVPSDSYGLLGELHATTSHLAQVCQQLGRWHATARDQGHMHDPTDQAAAASATMAADALEKASASLEAATQQIMAAHSANAPIRWTR